MMGPGRLLRRVRGCPPGWRITRAVSDPHDPLRAHIEGCAWCAAAYRDLRELVHRADVLATTDDMSPQTKQAISTRLLVGSAPSSAPRVRRAVPHLWRGAVGAAALAIGGVLWTVWAPPGTKGDAHLADSRPPSVNRAASTATLDVAHETQTPPKSRASVRALAAARFTRVSAPPDERILLREGVIVLDVVRLVRGERFRVVTDDAEVEVRGTHFEVSASGGRLIAVRVTSGRVQVTSRAGALAMLEAGDEWVGGAASPATAVAAPTDSTDPRTGSGDWHAGTGADSSQRTKPARRGSPPIRDREGPRRSTGAPGTADRPRPSAVTASFDRGWSLLRKGDTQEAAAVFAEVESAAGGGSLAEDAAYWRAVAIARGGDSVAARNLFAEFLRRFPASPRRGEASVALGWILLESRRTDEARSAFERAAADPSAPVRASAAEGLRRTGTP